MANFELGNLVWRVKGDTTDFDKQIGGAQSRMQKMGASLVKIGSSLTKFVTLPLLGIGVAATKAASDLGESLNAVSVVFGDSVDTIIEFGEIAAEQAGLSQEAFNSLATVIGSVLKQSGLDMDDVADQTVELTQRAADLASVFNVEVSEAMQALGAAIRGESEPARRFGINISDAAIQAHALAIGLVESKNEINDQIKVQARYSLIMEQSEQVAGDFVNTSDQVANQMRILKSNLTNVAAELGEMFIPILASAVGKLQSAVEWFGELDDGTKRTIVTIAGVAAALGPLALGIAGIIKVIGAAKVAVLALNTAFTTLLASPIGLTLAAIGVAIGVVAAALIVAKQRQRAMNEATEAGAEARREQAEALREVAQETRDLWAAQVDQAALHATLAENLIEDKRLYEETGDASAQFARALLIQTKAETELAIARGEGADAVQREINTLVALNEGLEFTIVAEGILKGAIDARVEALVELREEHRREQAGENISRIQELQAALELLNIKYHALGAEDGPIDLVSEQTKLYRDALDDLIEDGMDPATVAMQGLIRTYLGLLEVIEDEELADFGIPDPKAIKEAERTLISVGANLEASAERRAASADERAAKEQAQADAAARAAEELAQLRIDLFGTETEQWEFALAQQVAAYRVAGLEELEIARFIADERAKLEDDKAKAAIKKDKEILKSAEETTSGMLALYMGYASLFADIFDNILDIRLNQAEAEANAQIESLDAQALGEAAYAEEVGRIRQESAIAQWEVEKELFKLRQAANVAQIAMDTVTAIMAGYAALGPIGGTIAAVILGALGVTSAGVVLSEPPPPRPTFAMGGDFLTNGPQEILVGDNPGGQERVTIDPVGSETDRPMQVILMLDGRLVADSTVSYINNGQVRIEARS